MNETKNWVEIGEVLNKLIDKKYTCVIDRLSLANPTSFPPSTSSAPYVRTWTIMYNERKIGRLYYLEECAVCYSMISSVQVKYDDPEYVDKLNGFIKTLELVYKNA